MSLTQQLSTDQGTLTLLSKECAAELNKSTKAIRVRLNVHSELAVRAGQQPLSFGVPFGKGLVFDPQRIGFVDGRGTELPLQVEVLDRWSDGSIKWLLCDLRAPKIAKGVSHWELHDQRHEPCENEYSVRLHDDETSIFVDTGKHKFKISKDKFLPFQSIARTKPESLAHSESNVVLTDRKGRSHTATIKSWEVESSGPVRTTLCINAEFEKLRGICLQARICFFAGSGLVRLRVTLLNSNRARHHGGLWDLGDAGSFLFRDFTFELDHGEYDASVNWRSADDENATDVENNELEIYQDSSGGENWQSRNHVNRDGRVPCQFRGYRVTSGDTVGQGMRCSPIIETKTNSGSITSTLTDFWQQFPKAAEVNGSTTSWRLFPRQWDDLFELQGGERKTHTLWLDFADAEDAADGRVEARSLDWVHSPAHVCAEPESYEETEAIAHFSASHRDTDKRLASLMTAALDGPKNFFAKREVIDEYGWRNFGDLWADHEDVHFEGQSPVVSHYNNQFDVVYGAIVQMMRTGNPRWADVFEPLGRHVCDIDIYHTTEDKAAYGGGLFWHTDHYVDAETSSHRTYSQANSGKNGADYGGGPSNEHNYTTGLLHYYYLTGDPAAREAVQGLADWVINMDDGSKSVFRFVDDGPSGLASKNCGEDYHGPGRGSANSVNTLLDAWQVSRQRKYMDKAEQLIQRVVHPADDLDERNLLDAEHRWSYTMFLASLSKYLDIKSEQDEIDETYHYARQSLLHYGTWMLENERPYLDYPEQLEYPTEAWAAQEFRKANVLRYSAKFADETTAELMYRRADELSERAWADLFGFDTHMTTRALAIVMVEGARDAYFRANGVTSARQVVKDGDFGNPSRFVGHKQRVLTELKSVRGLARIAWRLIQPGNWHRFF